MGSIISKYNLDNWWKNELTQEDRETIEKVYAHFLLPVK
jgi:hypothetical protein